MTGEQYLEIERTAAFRSEYHDGRMFAMAGGTRNHARLAFQLGSLLDRQLEGRGCLIYGSDLRLHVPAAGLYTYPDLTVVCDEERVEHGDCLLNPILVAEVLSPSTEAYDRGKKFDAYRSVPSLMAYLLIAQDRARVDFFARQSGGEWLVTAAAGLDAVIEIRSLGCRVDLRKLYANVLP